MGWSVQSEIVEMGDVVGWIWYVLFEYVYLVINNNNKMATHIKDIGLDACVICSKPTDQCCSLCRKAFYCSP